MPAHPNQRHQPHQQPQYSSHRAPFIRTIIKLPRPTSTTPATTMQDKFSPSIESAAGRAHIASLSAIRQLDQTPTLEGNKSSAQRDTHRVSNGNLAKSQQVRQPSPTKTSQPANSPRLSSSVPLTSGLSPRREPAPPSVPKPASSRNVTIEAVAAALSLARNPNAKPAPPFNQPCGPTEPANPSLTSTSQRTPGIKMKSRPKNSERLANSASNTFASPEKSQGKSLATLEIPFTWERYLAITGTQPAPSEAFMQPRLPLNNEFKPRMMLEARDVKSNIGAWSLTTVVSVDGLRLRLRFEGSDHMNDFYEVIDSDNIRPVGGGQSSGQALLPPMRYKKNIINYLKFVEKVLSNPETVIAPPNLFPPGPKKPLRNLFQEGMRLEAIDRKNTDLICPAHIGAVNGDDVQIVFDGWTGRFHYTCKYYSRELFPINWCRDSGSVIVTPPNWQSLLQGNSGSPPIDDHSSSAKISNNLPSSDSKQPKRVHKQSSSKSSSVNQVGPLKIKLVKKKKKKAKDSPSKRTNVQSTPKTSKRSQSSGNDFASDRTTATSPSLVLHESENSQDLREAKPVYDTDMTEDNSHTENGTANCFDDVNDHTKFRCQRAVPYDEWLKHKNDKPDVGTGGESTKDAASLANETNNDDVRSLNSTDSEGVVYKSQKKERLSSDEESLSTKRVKRDSHQSIVNHDQQQVDNTINGGFTNSQSEDSKTETKPATEQASNYTPQIQASTNASYGYESWTVNDVIQFLISHDDSLAKYSSIFVDHEIDGKAFVLLTSTIIIQHMGIKLGPSLKICTLIEQAKKLR